MTIINLFGILLFYNLVSIIAFTGWVDPDTAADKKTLTSFTGI